MNESFMKIVSIDSLIHLFAARGFAPADVSEAFRDYASALGLLPDSGNSYLMHASEISAFTLFLNRHHTPVSLALHDLRTEAVLSTVESVLRNWGETPGEVTDVLDLDLPQCDSYRVIVSQVAAKLRAEVRAEAITVTANSAIVDGVEVDYPNAVAFALRAAAIRVATRTAYSPF